MNFVMIFLDLEKDLPCLNSIYRLYIDFWTYSNNKYLIINNYIIFLIRFVKVLWIDKSIFAKIRNLKILSNIEIHFPIYFLHYFNLYTQVFNLLLEIMLYSQTRLSNTSKYFILINWWKCTCTYSTRKSNAFSIKHQLSIKFQPNH